MGSKENFNKKLLVEGNDDQHVIWALCEKFQLPHNFDVIDCKGISKLFEQLPLRFKQANIETIGVIIDADIEIKDRWKSIRSTLMGLGFNPPEKLSKEGLIISNGEIKVGIWIMPNNNLNGMLEDFISFLIPDEDKLIPIIKNTLESIETQKLNKYSLIHKSKAIIHSWLAIQEDPGTPMGLAITKRYLSADAETSLELIKWLSELFK